MQHLDLGPGKPISGHRFALGFGTHGDSST